MEGNLDGVKISFDFPISENNKTSYKLERLIDLTFLTNNGLDKGEERFSKKNQKGFKKDQKLQRKICSNNLLNIFRSIMKDLEKNEEFKNCILNYTTNQKQNINERDCSGSNNCNNNKTNFNLTTASDLKEKSFKEIKKNEIKNGYRDKTLYKENQNFQQDKKTGQSIENSKNKSKNQNTVKQAKKKYKPNTIFDHNQKNMQFKTEKNESTVLQKKEIKFAFHEKYNPQNTSNSFLATLNTNQSDKKTTSNKNKNKNVGSSTVFLEKSSLIPNKYFSNKSGNMFKNISALHYISKLQPSVSFFTQLKLETLKSNYISTKQEIDKKFNSWSSNIDRCGLFYIPEFEKNFENKLSQILSLYNELMTDLDKKTFEIINNLEVLEFKIDVKKQMSWNSSEKLSVNDPNLSEKSSKIHLNSSPNPNSTRRLYSKLKIERKRLGSHAKQTLQKWFDERYNTESGPYATYEQKKKLAVSSGITIKQVTSYLGNRRRKIRENYLCGSLKKPLWL